VLHDRRASETIEPARGPSWPAATLDAAHALASVPGRIMTRRFQALAPVLSLALVLALPAARARAFCGFYVAGSETALHNHATTVVLMREGHRTVLSMQNDYAGPPEDFAMVVPVPVVLERDDVRTLDRALFERVERLTGPRLVEYWETDPCVPDTIGLGSLGTMGRGAGAGTGFGFGGGGGGSFVRIEAQFAVGEYDIVVLGTNDSSALDGWLREHHYRIPEGAAEALRPYVESGMKFFVARVDAERVRFEAGRAVLSPLRVHYESEQLSLPVRLGLLNSAGAQDLVVVVLAREQRFEMANYPNAFIPTNLDVADSVRGDFGAFYEALLTRTFERHPGAVITEYSWQATSCDPCPPDATLDAQTLTSLGGDVLYQGGVQPGSLGIGRGGPWGSGRMSAAPVVRMEPPRVSEGLPREVIQRVARRHVNELRYCFEQSLAQNPNAQGVVDVGLVISPTGAVTSSTATARPDATLSANVTSCIGSATRRWTFPAPEDDRVVQAALAVRFTPSPQASASDPTSARAPTAYDGDFVATRLHYRYGREGLGEDLVFRAAGAVTGGREVPREGGGLEEGATPAAYNNFQGRYAIRHAWEGPIACEQPIRGRWGGQPPGADPSAGIGFGTGVSVPTVAPAHASNAPADAARAPVVLESVVYTAAPDVGLAGRDASAPTSATSEAATPPSPPHDPSATAAPSPASHAPSATPAPTPSEGGGLCATTRTRAHAPSFLALALALGLLARRRRASQERT
jgi:hypothetical protein